MWTTKTKAIAALTAMTMAATAVVPLQAEAAPAAKPTTVKSATDGSTDFSAARRYRRGNNAAAAAMFGAVAGTIATIAVAQQRRKAQRDYYRARYGYGAYPGYYGYYGPDYNYQGPAWTGPRAYGGGPYYYGGKRPYQYTSPW